MALPPPLLAISAKRLLHPPALARSRSPHSLSSRRRSSQLTSYDNTPKARSVRASGGTVVLSDWVLACESERALLPFGRWLVHEGTNSWRSASASAAAAAGGSSDPSAAGRSRSGGDGGGGKGRAGGSAGAGGGGASASGKGGSGGGGGRGSGGASGSGASGRVRGPTAAEIAAKLLPDDLLQPIVVRDLAKFERALEVRCGRRTSESL